MKKCLTVLAITIALFTSGVVLAADPLTDLGDAVAYWQEVAINMTVENEKLRSENERLRLDNEILTSKNAKLVLDVESAETTMRTLTTAVNDMDKLRIQAESDLDVALAQCESLEKIIKKLSGPRFNAIVGATYDIGGSFGLLAGLGMSL